MKRQNLLKWDLFEIFSLAAHLVMALPGYHTLVINKIHVWHVYLHY